MSGDFKRSTDQLTSMPGGENAGKGKENIAQLTEMLEQKSPNVEFANLGFSTDAQYDQATDTIMLAEDYRATMEQEPELLEPLVAHERVHAAYQSDAPTDEASLQAYVNEEMAAYQAEYNAWQQVKAQYTSPEGRAALDPAGKELVGRYEFKMNQIEQAGWDGYRAQLEKQYRERMLQRKGE